MKRFHESEKFAERNRRNAANMTTTITRMADKSWGTTVLWGAFLTSLTRDEALRLATQLVHDIDEIDQRTKQPKVSRTITRTYLEKETNNE